MSHAAFMMKKNKSGMMFSKKCQHEAPDKLGSANFGGNLCLELSL